MGELQSAIQSLESITSNTSELVARSEILARIQQLRAATPAAATAEKVRDLVAQTKSLDEIPVALKALNALRDTSGAPMQRTEQELQSLIEAVRSDLASLQATYQEFRAGMPTDFNLRSHNLGPQGDTARGMTAHPRAKLLRIVVPRALGLNEGPRRDESIEAFLNREVLEAFTRDDPHLIARVCQVQGQVVGNVNPSDIYIAVQPLLAARNQEAAGQIVPAVVSYQTALKIGGDIIPAKAIGAHLDALRAEHPAEFEQGLQKFLSSPPSAISHSNIQDGILRVPGAGPSVSPPGR